MVKLAAVMYRCTPGPCDITVGCGYMCNRAHSDHTQPGLNFTNEGSKKLLFSLLLSYSLTTTISYKPKAIAR